MLKFGKLKKNSGTEETNKKACQNIPYTKNNLFNLSTELP